MVERICIKPDVCIACKRCEVACIASHHELTMKEAMKHRDLFTPRVHVVKSEGIKTSVRCHQCDPAPCCNICPTKAIQQAEDGHIIMHGEQCIACKMCVAACPYGAISIDTLGVDLAPSEDESLPAAVGQPRRVVAVRCDLCQSWRKANGKKITACMEACPKRALYLVEADGNIVEMPEPEKKAPKAASA